MTTSAIAVSQGVTIGGKLYNESGMMPYASQTGGHADYGWNHSDLLQGAHSHKTRAILANAFSRPMVYTGIGYRQTGYNIAGRPLGWHPEDGLDIGHGWKRGRRKYISANGYTETVSGMEPQHWWASHLFALYDARDMTPVDVPIYGTVPAWKCARWLLLRWAETLGGMLKLDGEWLPGGRASALIIHFFNQLSKRKLLADPDGLPVAKIYVTWLEDYGLPQLERAPGVRETKNEGVCRWVQECGLMLPAAYEASQQANGTLADRFTAIGRRISQWMLDIDAVAGGKAKWYNLRITPDILAGDKGGVPLASIRDAIDANDLTDVHQDDYTLWSVRAADLASYYHPGAGSYAFTNRVVEKATKNASGADLVWLTDKDGDYL